MEWRCTECGQAYDEDPGVCACGSVALEPTDGSEPSRFSLSAVRERLLNPKRADRSLVREEPYVDFVFRVVVAVLLLIVALLALLAFL